MAGRIGGKVALDGEKQFKQAVRGINDEFRVMKAELKQVSTEFTRNNKTIGDAKKENKELEKNIDQLNKRLIEQEKGLKNASENFGEADKERLNGKKKSLRPNQKSINSITELKITIQILNVQAIPQRKHQMKHLYLVVH